MKSPAPKLVVVVAALTLAVLAVASMPSPASARDRDCPDFSTQRAAQIFFLKHGGPRYDPDRLDADDDGIACEDNPCPCYFKKHLPKRANRDGVPAPLDERTQALGASYPPAGDACIGDSP